MFNLPGNNIDKTVDILNNQHLSPIPALQGIMDGQVVNIADEAPTTLYELLHLVGKNMTSSAEPLVNPWYLHADTSLARSLGFQPSVRSVYQAAQENLL